MDEEKPAAPLSRNDGLRFVAWVVLALGVALDVALLGPSFGVANSMDWGGDFIVLRNAAITWESGGDFYPAFQLAGPYGERTQANILYPPIALALFLPFVVLPAFLWWAGPLAIVAGTVWYWRPNRWALAGIGLCAVSWPMVIAVHQGNPVMWVAAAVALGTRWPAYAALVLLKPSLAPFALLGIRHRGWWIVAGVMGVASLLLLPMTLDWLTVLRNLEGGRTGFLYSITEVPILAIPILAWITSPRRRRGSSPR